MFYTYLNNCVENAYIIIEAANQSASDTKGATLGVNVGTGHREFTKTDSDKTSPTIDGTIIANLVGNDWESAGSNKHGTVVFSNGGVVNY